jgi:hypothetical protein
VVERLVRERQRVDQDRVDRVGRADEPDPLVVDRPAPDAGHDLVDVVCDRLRLAHRGNLYL